MSFNSILVRLKAQQTQHKNDPTLFQFHTGSIKSFLLILTGVSDHRFNSILVRLKVFS